MQGFALRKHKFRLRSGKLVPESRRRSSLAIIDYTSLLADIFSGNTVQVPVLSQDHVIVHFNLGPGTFFQHKGVIRQGP
ncbi:MAG: hypothetical protein D4R64_10965 [Porphyromonadaceae bacterium]|nr:MAG: hypothetical protein D4R64_10965 [Porphyromonadaceae bacterium]